MLEATLVGLQAVRQAFGNDDATTKAAAHCTGSVLNSVLNELQQVFDDEVVFQVGGLCCCMKLHPASPHLKDAGLCVCVRA